MTLPANPALWALIAIALLVVALIARTVSGRRRAAREREGFQGGLGARPAEVVTLTARTVGGRRRAARGREWFQEWLRARLAAVVAPIARMGGGVRVTARRGERFQGRVGIRRAAAATPRGNGQAPGAHGAPLDPTVRERVARLWAGVQSRFVDDPRGAVVEADQVVSEVMRARGYSGDVEFEHRAADVSANHPHLAEHYRVASEIVRRELGQEAVSTEELRTALLRYRALVDGLLGPQGVRRFDRRT